MALDTGRADKVIDLAPGDVGSNPEELTPWKGELFFVADDGLHGAELWATRGAPESTRLVRDIISGVPLDSEAETVSASLQTE